jgi:hypothetical protein
MPRAAGLVTVQLRGTNLAIVPDQVTLIVEDPEGAAAGAAEFWGVPVEQGATRLNHAGVMYWFLSPDDTTGWSHKAGDVVYTFLAESAEHKRRILRGAENLKPVRAADAEEAGQGARLLSEQEGFYVHVPVKQTVWTCSMHPEVQKADGGKCPKCGMDLIEAEMYW